MTMLRIDHVQLAIPAGGEDAARAFWVGLLGFVEIPKPPLLAVRGGAWFQSGGVQVHVGVETPFAPARKAHPALLCDDLDALAQRLESAGRPVQWSDEVPGTRRFHAEDSHGNRLEFMGS